MRLRPARPDPAFAPARAALAGVLLAATALPAEAQERQQVKASAPLSQAVTIYRDPQRGPGERLQRDWPRGFALITETRDVTLPPGRSTIRFAGVAEGMVAVSAIVSGLPGGTIEQNRDANLLSPAALVDGTLGNRVLITRTDPASGVEREERAIIRTRADGGLVVETAAGFEAVRCAGLPERLAFDAVPAGLSSEPVFSLDTEAPAGGRYTVTLSYLSWGFDWEASYVATLDEGARGDGEVSLALTSWLTLLNDNGQSFEDAELLVVAGRLNIASDFASLAAPPQGRPLALTCYPLGSTAAGSPEPWSWPAPPPPPPPMAAPPPAPMMMRSAALDAAQEIVVTGAMLAAEEDLGDLKLYRVPERLTVAAQSLKQVAFLERGAVEARLIYAAGCEPQGGTAQAIPARIRLETVNDEEHGLGVALPAGRLALFDRQVAGGLLVAETDLRDHASGQDVELELGASATVFARCEDAGPAAGPKGWRRLVARLSNANPHPVTVELDAGAPQDWEVRGIETGLVDGRRTARIAVPANGERRVEWTVRAISR